MAGLAQGFAEQAINCFRTGRDALANQYFRACMAVLGSQGLGADRFDAVFEAINRGDFIAAGEVIRLTILPICPLADAMERGLLIGPRPD